MASTEEKWNSAKTIYEFELNDISGAPVSMDKYKGSVCLVVNVASKWGFTDKNYHQLVELDTKYGEKSFHILAFPCNQFSSQEPASDSDIKSHVVSKFGVKFDLFAKIEVNGAQADPLYKFLKSKQKGILGFNGIKWNFTKFLINKEGVPVKRYSPTTDPMSISKDIEKYLKQ